MKLSDFSLSVPEKKGPSAASSKSGELVHTKAEFAPAFATEFVAGQGNTLENLFCSIAMRNAESLALAGGGVAQFDLGAASPDTLHVGGAAGIIDQTQVGQTAAVGQRRFFTDAQGNGLHGGRWLLCCDRSGRGGGGL